ncbi:MAG: hypothetical protein AB1801_01005 [Chloroflexota bacterium]
MSIFKAWVLRANALRFTAGCQTLQLDRPRFADLIKVQQSNLTSFGLIYDIRAQDDLAVRQLILTGRLEPEAILDQQLNRLVPLEIQVLALGYRQGQTTVVYGLPPQPPLSLDVLTVCTDSELRSFSACLDYLPLILKASQVPVDELVVAHLRRMAAVQPAEVRTQFLLEAGRRLAHWLYNDIPRLEAMLRRIRPTD